MNPNTLQACKAQIAVLVSNNPELITDETLRAGMIEGETDFPEIMATLMREYREADALASGLDAQVTEDIRRVNRLQQRAERLKNAMLQMMDAAGLSKYAMPEATLSISKVRPSVHVVNQSLLAEKYLRTKTTTEPDKKAIAADLEAGLMVEGAQFNNSPPSLRMIR